MKQIKGPPCRKVPYTEIGISRVPCSRCGHPSQQQWSICADKNSFRGICVECDIALNNMVLRFFNDSQRIPKMKMYRRKLGTVAAK